MTILPDDPLSSGGIAVFAEDLRAGKTSAKKAVRAYLDRIDALEPKLNAYQFVAYEQAEEAAEAAARKRTVDAIMASTTFDEMCLAIASGPPPKRRLRVITGKQRSCGQSTHRSSAG